MYKSITFFTVTHAQTLERSTGRPITSSVRDEKKSVRCTSTTAARFSSTRALGFFNTPAGGDVVHKSL